VQLNTREETWRQLAIESAAACSASKCSRKACNSLICFSLRLTASNSRLLASTRCAAAAKSLSNACPYGNQIHQISFFCLHNKESLPITHEENGKMYFKKYQEQPNQQACPKP
jgi:hypothetical protein